MSKGAIVGAFHVNYVQQKNCFLYLHSKWLKKISKNRNIVCVRLKVNDGSEFVCSCNSIPFNYNGENTVGLNATFANSLGITEGLSVIIFDVDKLNIAKSVSVKPCSIYDREVLESEFQTVQNSLLDQICVVNVAQKLPIWISSWVVVNVYICDIDNGSYKSAKLAEYSEVHVIYDIVENDNKISSKEPYRNNNHDNNRTIDSNNRNNWNHIIEQKQYDETSSYRYWTKYVDVTSYYLRHLYSWFVKGNLTKPIEQGQSRAYICQPFTDMFTVLPLVWLRHSFPMITTTSLQPYDVVVSERNLIHIRSYLSKKGLTDSYALCALNYVPISSSDGEKKLERLQHFYETVFTVPTANDGDNLNTNINNDDDDDDYRLIYVRVFTIESLLPPDEIDVPLHFTSSRSIFVSSVVQNHFRMTVGSKIRLDLIHDHLMNSKKVRKIELITASDDTPNDAKEKITGAFKDIINRSSLAEPIFLNNRRFYSIKNGAEDVKFFLQFSPSFCPFIYINRFDFDDLDNQLQWRKNHSSAIDKSLDCEEYKCSCEEACRIYLFRYLQNVLHEQILSVILNSNLTGTYVDSNRGGITGTNHLLIEGGVGSGKSTIVDLFATYLEKSHTYVYLKKLRCKTLKGKHIVKLEQLLNKAISECIYYQPAVLVLDDIDALVPISRSEDTHNIKYKQRLVNALYDLLNSVSNNRISIIATAASATHLGEYLFDSRGSSVFTYKAQLPNLTHEDRVQIFKTLLFDQLQHPLSPEIDSSFIDNFMKKTEGYCIQDIVDFKNKLYFQLIKSKDGTCEVQVKKQHMEDALEQVFPLAWSGIDLHKNTDTTWADVGGLDDVKQILTEIIIWPSLYPEVFEQCPLRVQSGILLYGLPGSGKTLIAAAIAGECNINFISIKGPELLSKYTGSSEQKVRETFQKANSAKPCILFFDEFESLAARRGNDVTGVTDRVVNQLLTEMDGIESRSGVWILAASSRPDLIDPALLRPGRLGTKVYCRKPNKEGRLSILNVLSSSYPLTDDVDLIDIAGITENYLGPDLQAVLYTAYSYNLNSESESSSCSNHSLQQSQKATENAKVTHEQLLRAVRETKPSLSEKELKKFENIYELFSGRIQRTGIIAQKITQA